jgi:hypothetical protein
MTIPACPYCGASPLLQSPSGHHLMCVGCNRVLMQPRIKKPRGRRARVKSEDSFTPSLLKMPRYERNARTPAKMN